MRAKRFVISSFVLALVAFVFVAGVTVYIDPFFHYHAPIEGLEYVLNDQRYQNNGILRHFEYDAIITGSSMTENFKTSELDAVFGTNSVKVSFSGSLLKETADQLARAFESDNSIKYVIRSLDYYALVAGKDQLSNFDYPDYLYDDDPFNDVKYLLNKSILVDYSLQTLLYTRAGKKTTSFDDYSAWSNRFKYGKQEVLSKTQRPTKAEDVPPDMDKIRQNIQQNVVSLAVDNPQTEFYLFFPPYSIVKWDHWAQSGGVDNAIDVYKTVAEALIGYENIHLFSFDTCFDIICDLDNYKDLEHYGEWINSQMLNWMYDGAYDLTEENYKAHFEEMRAFYSSYDYESIYE